MSNLLANRVRVSIACAALTFACGGKVVFVEDDGSPAQGGSLGNSNGGAPSVGAAPSVGGAPSQSVGGSGAGVTVGTPVTECQLACNTLFQCGLQPGNNGLALCPGLEPGDQQFFVDACSSTCEESMALIALIDPNDCEGTVETIEAVSPDFANTCASGF